MLSLDCLNFSIRASWATSNDSISSNENRSGLLLIREMNDSYSTGRPSIRMSSCSCSETG